MRERREWRTEDEGRRIIKTEFQLGGKVTFFV